MDATTRRAIEERAYFLWLEAGCPEGQENLHWLQAEAEVELGLHPEIPTSGLAEPEETAGSERPPAGEPYG